MRLTMPRLNEIPKRRLAIYAVAAIATVVALSFYDGEHQLSEADYVSEGRAICADKGDLLREQFERLAQDPSAQSEVAERASKISTDAFRDLLDLLPPESFEEARSAIVEGRDQLQDLQRDFTRGDIERDEVQTSGEKLERDIDEVWPGCSQALNPES